MCDDFRRDPLLLPNKLEQWRSQERTLASSGPEQPRRLTSVGHVSREPHPQSGAHREAGRRSLRKTNRWKVPGAELRHRGDGMAEEWCGRQWPLDRILFSKGKQAMMFFTGKLNTTRVSPSGGFFKKRFPERIATINFESLEEDVVPNVPRIS